MYVNPGFWELHRLQALGLKFQIASDADGLNFLSEKLTIGVVTVIIIDQDAKSSGTAYAIELNTGHQIRIQGPI